MFYFIWFLQLNVVQHIIKKPIIVTVKFSENIIFKLINYRLQSFYKASILVNFFTVCWLRQIM